MQSRWDCKGLEQNSRTKAPYIPASTQLHDGHITFLNGLSNLPGEARTLNPWKYALSRFTSKCFEAYWYPASLRQEQATSTKTKKLWIFQFEKRWNCPDACRKNLIASPGGETQDQPGQKKTTNQSRRVLFTVLKPWKHHQRLIAISFIPWKWWFKPSKEDIWQALYKYCNPAPPSAQKGCPCSPFVSVLDESETGSWMEDLDSLQGACRFTPHELKSV